MLAFTCRTSDKHCEKMFGINTDEEKKKKTHALLPYDCTAAQKVPPVVPMSLCST